MGKINTLVFAGGAVHDWKGCSEAIISVLSQRDEFEITKVEEDLDALAAPKLDPYDLVVFYYTIGEISDAQKNGLLNHIASGKGYVGVHSAADSFRECPEYRAMVGGYFVTHPRYRDYQVSIVDTAHPITEGLDETVVTDEQYILDYDPRNHVLASALWQGDARLHGRKTGAMDAYSIWRWDTMPKPASMRYLARCCSGGHSGQER